MFKQLLFLTILLSANIYADCSIDALDAAKLASNFIQDERVTFSPYIDTHNLNINNMAKDLKFLPSFKAYYYQVASINTDSVEGHIWLEVTCNQEVNLEFYVEEN